MSASAASREAPSASRRSRRSRRVTNPWSYCASLGFWAGLFWGTIRWLLYTFKFTSVLPAFLADPFFRRSFLVTGWGHGTGIAAFIVFSIVAAYLYKLLLGRFRGPWAGFFYGLLWWTLLFLAFGPLLGMMEPVTRIGWNSIFTEISLFIVWGMFIGYSIAFEFNDEASREPRKEP
ncbi:YqhR family membrane protein [Paenibacillus pasadenensis]|uniref:YqhR family membrane protein n=1 Tax=Paenibacillus pasadenensis TaxID=217090 RepID=UPI0004047EBE|nr:YqhR family membrane protein [Paenibacillus pasadenensis]